MRVVALLAVRNEKRYLARCLEHLHLHGVETCLIDNDSTDATLEIAERFRDRGVFRIDRLPFTGAFSLDEQLAVKERLATEIEADWFVHHDADEIREPPRPYQTLRDGIEAADRQGYNAIDFDEFVFVPTADDEPHGDGDYVERMRHYYYYEPDSPDRDRINAWKKGPVVDLRRFAGHRVVFPGLRLFPQPFVLRHYIALSRAHAVEKYGARRFAAPELARAWHGDRAAFDPIAFRFPPAERLKRLVSGGDFDKSAPWRAHPMFAPAPAPPRQREPRSRHAAALRRFLETERDHVPCIPPAPASVARPFWSVLIPTFEGTERFLVEALQSVLRQDPGPGEMQIEVVDDGTTAFDIETVVRQVGGGRIAFHRQPQRHGLPGNWNACLARAQGQWVHLLHQDDLVLDEFYASLRDGVERRADVGSAFCRAGGLDGDGRPTWLQRPEQPTAGVLDDDFIVRLVAKQRILTPAVVVRRAVYEEIGGYHTGLPYCADWDLYRRVALHGPVWYEPRLLARYRQHDRSATHRLQNAGADFADRIRALELGRSYLPPELAAATSGTAVQATLVWASEVLREALLCGDTRRAEAQAQAILRSLAQGESLDGTGRTADDHERTELVRRIDDLEAQVQAWMRAAEALGREARARGGQPRGDRE